MIVILYQDRCRDVADKTALELVGAFADQVTIAPIAADSAGGWPAEISWDDLLIVLYNGKDFPASGNAFIADYLQKRPETALLLPVALNTALPKPPGDRARGISLELVLAGNPRLKICTPNTQSHQ